MSDAYAPEALWLARWLDGTAPANAQKAAAVELERLWEENEKLWKERDELVEALRSVVAWMDAPDESAFSDTQLAAARAALAKVETSK